FFKGTKHPVVTHVDVSAAKAELVFAPGPAQVLRKLVEVLRAAEGNGVTRRFRRVSRQVHRGAEHLERRGPGEVHGGPNRSGAQRLEVEEAVVGDLGRAHDAG